MGQLLSLKMVASESVEAFTDRFQRIRRAAKWDDDIRTATIFKRALPAFLRQGVSRSLFNLSRDQQDTVNKVAAKARMIISSNICQNDPSTSRSVPRLLSLLAIVLSPVHTFFLKVRMLPNTTPRMPNVI